MGRHEITRVEIEPFWSCPYDGLPEGELVPHLAAVLDQAGLDPFLEDDEGGAVGFQHAHDLGHYLGEEVLEIVLGQVVGVAVVALLPEVGRVGPLGRAAGVVWCPTPVLFLRLYGGDVTTIPTESSSMAPMMSRQSPCMTWFSMAVSPLAVWGASLPGGVRGFRPGLARQVDDLVSGFLVGVVSRLGPWGLGAGFLHGPGGEGPDGRVGGFVELPGAPAPGVAPVVLGAAGDPIRR